MNIPRVVIFLFTSLWAFSVVSAAEKTRTFADIPGLSDSILKRTVSPTIYRELHVSPVQSWIAVQGQLSGTRIFGTRILHSEGNGAYDKYALQLAREWRIAGHYGIDKLDPTTPVVVNVLIYQIADGIMAVSFPCFNEPGGTQLEYYGAAKLAVQQIDGRWKDLALPQGPLKGLWAVRSGLRNNFELEMKLNQIEPGR
ncbi:MAG: hypothetical protein H0X40_11490 [Chthoniobacterales bacterium]|nr:hypothetical protein [Chthoniobacterales bacterium]